MKKFIFIAIIFLVCFSGKTVNSASKSKSGTSIGLLYSDLVLLPVIISEVLPRPVTGQQEYIKLENQGSEPVKLSDLSLKIGDKVYALKNDKQIPSHGFYTIGQAELPTSLRDSGRVVSVLDKHRRVLFETSYVNAPKGQTWKIQTDGSFVWSGQVKGVGKNVLGKQYAKSESGQSQKNLTVVNMETNLEKKQDQSPNLSKQLGEDKSEVSKIQDTKPKSENYSFLYFIASMAVVSFLGLLAAKKLI